MALSPAVKFILTTMASMNPHNEPLVMPGGLDKYRHTDRTALTPHDEEAMRRAAEKRARKALKRISGFGGR